VGRLPALRPAPPHQPGAVPAQPGHALPRTRAPVRHGRKHGGGTVARGGVVCRQGAVPPNLAPRPGRAVHPRRRVGALRGDQHPVHRRGQGRRPARAPGHGPVVAARRRQPRLGRSLDRGRLEIPGKRHGVLRTEPDLVRGPGPAHAQGGCAGLRPVRGRFGVPHRPRLLPGRQHGALCPPGARAGSRDRGPRPAGAGARRLFLRLLPGWRAARDQGRDRQPRPRLDHSRPRRLFRLQFRGRVPGLDHARHPRHGGNGYPVVPGRAPSTARHAGVRLARGVGRCLRRHAQPGTGAPAGRTRETLGPAAAGTAGTPAPESGSGGRARGRLAAPPEVRTCFALAPPAARNP